MCTHTCIYINSYVIIVAIEELLVSWDKATTSVPQAMARASETPSTTLYV